MENSRKSPSLNKSGGVKAVFERALGDILARVSVCAADNKPQIGVAFSGGLDSSVLLHLSGQYAEKHDISVHAFHIHHGFSPNADAWESHCRRVAGACKVSFSSSRVSVSDIGDRGLEEAARVARYQALSELCQSEKVPLLLMAHHLDDQAETVMLQLMRGAGLPGLSAMAPYQEQHKLLGPGIAIGRPLLDLSRAALEEFAKQLELTHVSDESNADTAYKRNALRQVIFPVIETHFPAFGPLMARTATHAQSAQALLHDLAMIDLAVCQHDETGKALCITALQRLSEMRIDNLLRHWLHSANVQLPSTARLDEIRSQMLTAEIDKHPFFDFGNVRLHRIENRLELHPNLGMPPSEEIMLAWNGEREIRVPQWHGKLVFEHANGPGLDEQALRKGLLALRPRSGQEKLKIAENRPTKSLKNIFQEYSIPSWQRKWAPTLYLNDNLVFVANLGMNVRHCNIGKTLSLRWESE